MEHARNVNAKMDYFHFLPAFRGHLYVCKAFIALILQGKVSLSKIQTWEHVQKGVGFILKLEMRSGLSN